MRQKCITEIAEIEGILDYLTQKRYVEGEGVKNIIFVDDLKEELVKVFS